jgi:hypothetical protein
MAGLLCALAGTDGIWTRVLRTGVEAGAAVNFLGLSMGVLKGREARSSSVNNLV